MIEIYYTLKGAIIGFIVALPIGPVSLLCIRRSLSEGRVKGLATGLGAVLGDMFYASIAAFGLTFVVNFLRKEEFLLRLIGGGFLIVMSLCVILKKTKPTNVNYIKEEGRLREALGSAFLLDISNPIIILAYLALFSGFGLADAKQNVLSAISLVVGVAIGAATWWFCLIQLVCLFRKKIKPTTISLISNVAALFLATFGGLIIISSFYPIPFLSGDF